MDSFSHILVMDFWIVQYINDGGHEPVLHVKRKILKGM